MRAPKRDRLARGRISAASLEEEVKAETGSTTSPTPPKSPAAPKEEKKIELKPNHKKNSEQSLRGEVVRLLVASRYDKTDSCSTRISNKNRRRLKMLLGAVPGISMQDFLDNLLDEYFESNDKEIKKLTEL